MPPALGSGLAAEKARTGGRGGRGRGRQPRDTDQRSHLQQRDVADEEDEGVITSAKRSGGANYWDDEEDQDVGRMEGEMSGEEDEQNERFNEVGEQIEPFNLKEEREEGYFDANGNYVWRKNEEAPDEWLQSMNDESAMEAMIGEAATAHRKRLVEQQAKEKKEAAEGPVNTTQLMSTLAEVLLDEEPVLHALNRLAPPKSQRKQGKLVKPEDRRSADEKKAFELVTDAADKLLSEGVVNIYQFTKEELQDKVGAQQQVDVINQALFGQQQQQQQQQQAAESKHMWEYQGVDGQVHGPFKTTDIMQWRAQGFFTGESAVKMRVIRAVSEITESPSEPPQTSAHEDLMADFDDDDDDATESADQERATKKRKQESSDEGLRKKSRPSGGILGAGGLQSMNEPEDSPYQWQVSDTIDFSKFL